MKAYYLQYQTEILLIYVFGLQTIAILFLADLMLKRACEQHETNPQKATNSNTHKLTKIELAT